MYVPTAYLKVGSLLQSEKSYIKAIKERKEKIKPTKQKNPKPKKKTKHQPPQHSY